MEINDQLIQAIGWTILHSLWQGLTIFLIIKVLFFIGDEYISARSKSLLLTLGITTMFLWSVATFINFSIEPAYSTVSTLKNSLSGEELLVLSNGDETNTGIGWGTEIGYLNKITLYLPYIWMMGVFYYLSKTIAGLFWISSLKRHCQEPENELLELGEKVRNRLNLKKLEIKLSKSVSSPVVIGIVKNTVLFPISWSMGLSSQQLESIIAHEAGHIMRKDGILNLYISFVETIMFFNPFFWFLKEALKIEQEKACDFIAVQYSGNRNGYAQTLLSVAQHNLANDLILSSSFFKLNRNEFLHRIKYIMEGSMEKQTQEKQGSVILAMIMMIGMILFQINDLTERNVGGTPINENSVQANIISNGDINIESSDPEMNSDKLILKSSLTDEVEKIEDAETPVALAKVEPRKIKLKKLSSVGHEDVLTNQLTITIDTIPDSERWEEFADDMKRMEQEMARVLEGHEEKLEEMNEILSEFNIEWSDKMMDIHQDMRIDIDMDFGDLEEISERFADIQIELGEIQVDIDTDMMNRIHEEIEVNHEYLREIEERMEDEETRWKEEEKKWRAEERKWKEEERRYGDFEDELKRELVKDGLIGSEDDALKFKYDDSEISVNGEALDKNQEAKYRDLLNKYNMKGKGSIMWN